MWSRTMNGTIPRPSPRPSRHGGSVAVVAPRTRPQRTVVQRGRLTAPKAVAREAKGAAAVDVGDLAKAQVKGAPSRAKASRAKASRAGRLMRGRRASRGSRVSRALEMATDRSRGDAVGRDVVEAQHRVQAPNSPLKFLRNIVVSSTAGASSR